MSDRAEDPDSTTSQPSSMTKAHWRSFAHAETSSALLLVAAVVAALIWSNADLHSYEAVWGTHVSFELGSYRLSLDLHEWINAGLMSFFFLVVGLEARREFDIGDLRDKRWVLLAAIAGVSSMAVPAAIYVAFNAGHDSVHGWGVAMATDTAFALGILALFGSHLPASLRAFMLSITLVDDLVALVVITVVYSGDLNWTALAVAACGLLGVAGLRMSGIRGGGPLASMAVIVWIALLQAGVDPVVTGLAVGALAIAYPAGREDLERASGLFRRFREQPTPQLQRSAVLGLAAAISPNERLLGKFLPWVSFVIVPLFTLANAGIPLGAEALADAFSSPVTLGIVCGCILGNMIGIIGTLACAQKLSGGRLRPTVGWGSVTVGSAIAGASFTVSLLIASLAFHGKELDQARIGVVATTVAAYLLSATAAIIIMFLPEHRQARALLGSRQPLNDLPLAVHPDRDWIRGPHDAPVTVVEYADFECPYCGQAEPVVRELLTQLGENVRYVWRHLPLTDVHPHAQLAAEAAEIAGTQGSFWPMHDLLLQRQHALTPDDLVRYAHELELDVPAFREALERHHGAHKVAQDTNSADISGVSGTPTFFINGRRHHGPYDIKTLSQAIKTAQQQATTTHN